MATACPLFLLAAMMTFIPTVTPLPLVLRMTTACLLFLLAAMMTSIPPATPLPPNYARERSLLIQTEQSMRTGGRGAALNANERIVDAILLTEKRKLIEAARLNGTDFPASHNFLNLTARAAMEATQAFQIIKKMPKGGVLHVHDESLTSIDWLIHNVTYRSNCYICINGAFKIKFHFFTSPPSDPDCVWQLVSTVRGLSGDSSAFDRSLHSNISMVVSDPAKAYPDITAAWGRFMEYFGMTEGLILYAPVFRDYLWEGLEQFRADNVQYLEIRGLLPTVYELDGTVHDNDWVLNVYKQGIAAFVQRYPDFIGGRFIKTSLRFKKSDVMLDDVKEAMRLYTQNPGFVMGFDLVGQEDPLRPLTYYVDDLLYPAQQTPAVNLPYFFHAGETNWQGTATDYNLVDALMLNATRIGHGYALYKHPLLKEKIRQKAIAIEVNPISNQVLKLVGDMRNHPASSLIAENFPLVISSDDPATWGALPLSHDFYVTFMALMDEEAGLATLKQLAVNSIRYSAMTAQEKQKASILWNKKWDLFINELVRDIIYNTRPSVTLN